MDHQRSRALYDRALSVFPGGVNSPVRAVRPYPVFVDRGDGAHVVDVDGNRFLDYVMGYGPLLLGHSLPEEVQEAIAAQVAEGAMYGAPARPGLELAEFIVEHVDSVEKLRFVNSGTEATTTAVRLARGYTGRDKLVLIDSGYHGALDPALADDGAPGSPGITVGATADTITIPFNDPDAAERVFDRHGESIAAVMVEPLLGNKGCLDPVPGYLQTLRSLTETYNALLVFDEVMTGFRIGGLGCAQSVFDVKPDLTTFAKVIGGGFPVGAVGGSARIMDQLTPTGSVFHASTYAAHPVGMVAGLEMLRYANENDVYERLTTLGDQLRGAIADVLADTRPEYTVVGRDSMFKVVFTDAESAAPAAGCQAGCRHDPQCARYGTCPRDGRDIDAANGERWERLFWQSMKEHGVLLTANQDESQFLSAAHTKADIEKTIEAYKHAL